MDILHPKSDEELTVQRLQSWGTNYERRLCTNPKCAHEWDSNKSRPTLICDWCQSAGDVLAG